MPKKSARIGLVKDDPWLEPYEKDIEERLERCLNTISEITVEYGSLKKFAKAYEFFGINYDKKAKGWWYREWAPQAEALYLIGDFNDWNRESHPLTLTDGGCVGNFPGREKDASA